MGATFSAKKREGLGQELEQGLVFEGMELLWPGVSGLTAQVLACGLAVPQLGLSFQVTFIC